MTDALIAERSTEELSLFFCVNASGLPLAPPAATSASGGEQAGCFLPALLPTKLVLPFGAHLQGPCLLSVDRQ